LGLTTAEQAATYGQFDGAPSRAELERFFFLDDLDQQLVGRRRGEHNRLGLRCSLGRCGFWGRFCPIRWTCGGGRCFCGGWRSRPVGRSTVYRAVEPDIARTVTSTQDRHHPHQPLPLLPTRPAEPLTSGQPTERLPQPL